MLQSAVELFRDVPGVSGMAASGSVARGVADEFSDLDLGVFFADEAARDAAWERRWEWAIGPCFHRFDADHVRPHFVIYLFEPGVKTDLPLHLVTDPPAPDGAPFEVLWDATGEVARWVEASNAGMRERPPDWSEAAHEEERLWAWAYYCVRHLQRGEVYDVAADFPVLRAIVEAWHARLGGRAFFDVRRVHEREPETVEAFADLFPRSRPRCDAPCSACPTCTSASGPRSSGASRSSGARRRRRGSESGAGWSNSDSPRRAAPASGATSLLPAADAIGKAATCL